jgi:hypothetical protein
LAKEDGIKSSAILRIHIRHMGMMSMWDKIKEHMENTLGTPLGTLYGSTWKPLPTSEEK